MVTKDMLCPTLTPYSTQLAPSGSMGLADVITLTCSAQHHFSLCSGWLQGAISPWLKLLLAKSFECSNGWKSPSTVNCWLVPHWSKVLAGSQGLPFSCTWHWQWNGLGSSLSEATQHQKMKILSIEIIYKSYLVMENQMFFTSLMSHCLLLVKSHLFRKKNDTYFFLPSKNQTGQWKIWSTWTMISEENHQTGFDDQACKVWPVLKKRPETCSHLRFAIQHVRTGSGRSPGQYVDCFPAAWYCSQSQLCRWYRSIRRNTRWWESRAQREANDKAPKFDSGPNPSLLRNVKFQHRCTEW